MSGPNARSLIGTLAIIAIIVVWAFVVVSLIERAGNWTVLAQMAAFLIAGLVWVLPVRPLLTWMATGRFRR